VLKPLLKLIGSKQYPRGPGFKRARAHQLDLSGTRVEFKTPPNSDVMVPFDPMPEKYNLYDEKVRNYKPKKPTDMHWRTLYTEGWSFFGVPLVQGEIGQLNLGVFFVHTPRHGNLFNPDNFLNALDERLGGRYGPISEQHRAIARIDWQLKTIHGNDWVRYWNQKIDVLNNGVEWVTPITEEHMLFFGFPHFINRPNTRLNEAYSKLEDQIMSTVKIDWSADILRQKQAAAEKWPDVKLPRQRPVLEWPEEEWAKYAPKDELAELFEEAARETQALKEHNEAMRKKQALALEEADRLREKQKSKMQGK